MRRIRTECPRCGQQYDRPDLVTELWETKEKLKALQRSVATRVAKAAGLAAKARKGGSNE